MCGSTGARLEPSNPLILNNLELLNSSYRFVQRQPGRTDLVPRRVTRLVGGAARGVRSGQRNYPAMIARSALLASRSGLSHVPSVVPVGGVVGWTGNRRYRRGRLLPNTNQHQSSFPSGFETARPIEVRSFSTHHNGLVVL